MSGRDERDELDALFERYVEEHVLHGRRLDPADLCAGRLELLPALRSRIERYERLEADLDGGSGHEAETVVARDGRRSAEATADPAPLPSFPGFRTIERLGSGGQGDVYKLVDSRLGRTVAGKVIRRAGAAQATLAGFLREARTLALFQDPRIVQIHELRLEQDPSLLVMEYVQGFPLDEVTRSLDFAHRARVMAEVCDAIHRAHELGLTHRDLKPGNILLDAQLRPKILDFGLAATDPTQGHLVGSLPYLAPEQLDPGRPIDARTDVHALGVILYEILCGQRPYHGGTVEAMLLAIERGDPRLPCEVDAAVPEPLQAIALKALERDPALRYASAKDMARDLRRFTEGRPVLARPTLYQTILQRRVAPHLTAIAEWQSLALIHPHEGTRLARAYGDLERRDDDWIVESRSLSFSKIALYWGAFVLACGALLAFAAYRLFEAEAGLASPILLLALPALALAGTGILLERGEHRAVAVAFELASVTLVPLFLLVALPELGWLGVRDGRYGDLVIEDFDITHRQLQVSFLVGAAWAGVFAERTRTQALASVMTVMLALLHVAVLSEQGLVEWLEDGRWDAIAGRLLPLLLAFGAAGVVADTRGRRDLGRPLYVAAAITFVLALELSALDGKLFEHLGFSLAPFQPRDVSDPVLLDTLAAMTLVGLLVYGVGFVLERRGTKLMGSTAEILLVIAPFATLEPAAWLNGVGEYAKSFLWAYLALAVATAFLSRYQQRKSFFLAGLGNTAVALYLISQRYEWFDRPWWSGVVVSVALLALGLGFALHASERRRRAKTAT